MFRILCTLLLAGCAAFGTMGARAADDAALCRAVDDNALFVAEEAEGYLLINILGLPGPPAPDARAAFEQGLGECAVAHVKAQLAEDSTLATVEEIALDFVLMKSLDEYNQVDFNKIKRIGTGTMRHGDGTVNLEKINIDWSLIPQ